MANDKMSRLSVHLAPPSAAAGVATADRLRHQQQNNNEQQQRMQQRKLKHLLLQAAQKLHRLTLSRHLQAIQKEQSLSKEFSRIRTAWNEAKRKREQAAREMEEALDFCREVERAFGLGLASFGGNRYGTVSL